IYVAEPAQGTGLAQALLRDGEARIAAQGHGHARLFCVEQNARARAFYTRCGWVEDGFETARLDTAHWQGREGYPLHVCVFRKRLAV
ncbi:MAG TPA: GNAT family N-acetyltransferase, partial [Rhodobacterales bacterium]|nr:GNAT family N-acetyltransferase [Rhodobacterales bacterium]